MSKKIDLDRLTLNLAKCQKHINWHIEVNLQDIKMRFEPLVAHFVTASTCAHELNKDDRIEHKGCRVSLNCTTRTPTKYGVKRNPTYTKRKRCRSNYGCIPANRQHSTFQSLATQVLLYQPPSGRYSIWSPQIWSKFDGYTTVKRSKVAPIESLPTHYFAIHRYRN